MDLTIRQVMILRESVDAIEQAITDQHITVAQAKPILDALDAIDEIIGKGE